MIALLWLGCAEEPATQPLLPLLSGGWEGFVVEATLASRDVVAVFADAEGLHGSLAVEDRDEGLRIYELLDAVDVAPLGVSLRFVEVTGVRELRIDAAVPIPPLYGSWREQVWCEEEQATCETQGAVTLDRVE